MRKEILDFRSQKKYITVSALTRYYKLLASSEI